MPDELRRRQACGGRRNGTTQQLMTVRVGCSELLTQLSVENDQTGDVRIELHRAAEHSGIDRRVGRLVVGQLRTDRHPTGTEELTQGPDADHHRCIDDRPWGGQVVAVNHVAEQAELLRQRK
ncbi:hypothetical protein D9M69_459960 [compost metagenome]